MNREFYNRTYDNAQRPSGQRSYETEPEPASGYSNNSGYAGGSRGGTRARGGFMPKGTLPPKQQPTQPRGGGAPKSKILSTVASTPKNDPLHLEALLPNPGQESRPVAEEMVVYPGFYAISDLTRETHCQVAAVDTSVSRKVPERAFAYYVAVLAYARMLKVLKLSSKRVTAEEEAFMDLVYQGNFTPPESAFYLKGLGNCRLPNLRVLRFRAKKWDVVASADGSIGWFGKINADTHFLYASYPCLAVYVGRIQSDFNITNDRDLDPDWDLPDDIAPDDENAGYPTKNLLGYAPAQPLSPAQLQWYRNAGFSPNFAFDSEHDTIPFISGLMNAVQIEINAARIKTADVIDTGEGSVVQTVVTEVPAEPIGPRREARCPQVARHAFDISGAVVVASKSLRYLRRHYYIRGEKHMVYLRLQQLSRSPRRVDCNCKHLVFQYIGSPTTSLLSNS